MKGKWCHTTSLFSYFNEVKTSHHMHSLLKGGAEEGLGGLIATPRLYLRFSLRNWNLKINRVFFIFYFCPPHFYFSFYKGSGICKMKTSFLSFSASLCEDMKTHFLILSFNYSNPLCLFHKLKNEWREWKLVKSLRSIILSTHVNC